MEPLPGRRRGIWASLMKPNSLFCERTAQFFAYGPNAPHAALDLLTILLGHHRSRSKQPIPHQEQGVEVCPWVPVMEKVPLSQIDIYPDCREPSIAGAVHLRMDRAPHSAIYERTAEKNERGQHIDRQYHQARRRYHHQRGARPNLDIGRGAHIGLAIKNGITTVVMQYGMLLERFKQIPAVECLGYRSSMHEMAMDRIFDQRQNRVGDEQAQKNMFGNFSHKTPRQSISKQLIHLNNDRHHWQPGFNNEDCEFKLQLMGAFVNKDCE